MTILSGYCDFVPTIRSDSSPSKSTRAEYLMHRRTKPCPTFGETQPRSASSLAMAKPPILPKTFGVLYIGSAASERQRFGQTLCVSTRIIPKSGITKFSAWETSIAMPLKC